VLSEHAGDEVQEEEEKRTTSGVRRDANCDLVWVEMVRIICKLVPLLRIVDKVQDTFYL
jgi:hypothetical protein